MAKGETAFDLAGEMVRVGEWAGGSRLSESEQRAVLVPWLAAIQNHVDGPLAEALAGLDLSPESRAACDLAGVTVPQGG